VSLRITPCFIIRETGTSNIGKQSTSMMYQNVVSCNQRCCYWTISCGLYAVFSSQMHPFQHHLYLLILLGCIRVCFTVAYWFCWWGGCLTLDLKHRKFQEKALEQLKIIDGKGTGLFNRTHLSGILFSPSLCYDDTAKIPIHELAAFYSNFQWLV
jgi:hypothetical protein